MPENMYQAREDDHPLPRLSIENIGVIPRQIINLMRVKQWPKNGLVFIPLILNPQAEYNSYFQGLILFGVFCLLSSLVYTINDIADAENDRVHPTKRNRPIASGAISKSSAIYIALTLGCVIVPLAAGLPTSSMLMMAGYLIINILYSFRFKRVPILEIFFVSMGFVIRVFAGADVAEMSVSSEFIAFVFFFCAFISIGKRRRELTHSDLSDAPEQHRSVLQYYNVKFLDSLISMTVVMSGIFFWMHVIAQVQVSSLPSAIFGCLAGLAVTAIIFRYLQAIYVESSGGEPVSFLSKDTFIVLSGISWLLCYWLSISPLL